MSHLLQAERRKPALDVSYTVFANRKLAESESSGTGAMSAINRVTFEKYTADARRYVMKAAMRQVGFWAELALAPVPDLGHLHLLSSEMNEAVDMAERAFAQLFVINPQSLVVSRGGEGCGVGRQRVSSRPARGCNVERRRQPRPCCCCCALPACRPCACTRASSECTPQRRAHAGGAQCRCAASLHNRRCGPGCHTALAAASLMCAACS
jgi:hypothetical protein